MFYRIQDAEGNIVLYAARITEVDLPDGDVGLVAHGGSATVPLADHWTAHEIHVQDKFHHHLEGPSRVLRINRKTITVQSTSDGKVYDKEWKLQVIL